MNNKGQTLVVFVLILPILILGIFYIFITTYSKYEKNKQNNLIDILCKYSKEETDIKKIMQLSNENDKTQKIEIKRLKNSIQITLVKEAIFNIKIKTETIC